MGDRIHTDGEVTGNRAGSEQIDDKNKGHRTTTYTIAANLGGDGGDDDEGRWGTRFVFFLSQINGKKISTPFYAREPVTHTKHTNFTVTLFTDSEQVIRLRQRKRRRSRDVCEHPVRLDRVCLRIYAHFWRSTVPFHVLLLHTSAVLHGLEPPRETVRLNHSRGDRNLGDERERIKRC
jgi:hypothetical protein